MAKEKISELAAATALDGTELAVVVQGGDTVQTTTQDIADLGGGGASYLKYVALLTQTGTDAPVATVLENTLGGTVVWSYSDVGEYIATLTAAFTANKTGIVVGCGNGSETNFIAYWVSANAIEMDVFTGGSASDDLLFKTLIEIRVYP